MRANAGGDSSCSHRRTSQLTTVDGGSTATYIYDADGHRVEKPYPGGGYVDYLYDLAGNVEGEWMATSAVTGPEAQYVYLNGQLMAEYIASTTYFIHKDHLDSTRLITGVTQSLVDNMDFLPYGEQISGDGSISHKFTSKERDPETATSQGAVNGFDNFEARYMTGRLGRLMSPDPESVSGAAHMDDPQSWNGYAYVRNNPVNFLDPSGMIYCRTPTSDESKQGVTQVCDVTNSQYFLDPKKYDAQGYKYKKCDCDSGIDNDAHDHPNGNISRDYVGYELVFGLVYSGNKGLFSPSPSSFTRNQKK